MALQGAEFAIELLDEHFPSIAKADWRVILGSYAVVMNQVFKQKRPT